MTAEIILKYLREEADKAELKRKHDNIQYFSDRYYKAQRKLRRFVGCGSR